jgi:co-chaperonin GroES (HSP10)
MKTLAPGAGSAARLPVTWVEDIALLGNRYLIELLKPAEQSSGGIWIPERFQENWTHGIVRAVGAGESFPLPGITLEQRPWLSVGDEALFN